ncbi:hypothetical protein ACIP93_32525 [Streptomyces sp. NPDC088745]|uniref:hypothetical protein n=1 Tax=Streptomyces sp. NPDC088745 TaxID=3365884 RepID=UPI0038270128
MPETPPDHTFTFLRVVRVMVSVTAPDIAAAEEQYALIDGDTLEIGYASHAGPRVEYLAVDDTAPLVVDQINGWDAVPCEGCATEDERGYVVNGQCTRRTSCPDQCVNDGCAGRTDDGEGWDGECGNCADVRASHDDEAHQTARRADCVACELTA